MKKFFKILLLLQVFIQADLFFQEKVSSIIMDKLQNKPEEKFLNDFYKETFLFPVWIDKESITPLAKEFFKEIKNDYTLDLNSNIYRKTLALEDKINEVYNYDSPMNKKVFLEFAISKLYKDYAEYRIYGSLNWGAFQARVYNLKMDDVNAAWETYLPPINPISLISLAMFDGGLNKWLTKIEPKGYHYKALQKALIDYLALKNNGGWPKVYMDEVYRGGEINNSFMDLRERLLISGDYTYCDSPSLDIYDECLQESLKRFQKRHGLVSDGIIGPNTLKTLNISVDYRIKQIKLNLDRIKWLDRIEDKRKIVINIPDFKLDCEDNGSLIQTMKVITGKPKNPTPIFSNRVKTIVLNPYWNVPKSIIQKELIPKLLRNPNAMKSKGIEIRRGWSKSTKPINPATVNWAQYQYSKGVPYSFAQVPGKRNALGKIKFLFPNKFAVYMHDTPTKYLFGRNVRAFSHGCIRLSNPKGLLKTFSSFNNIDMNMANDKLDKNERKVLGIKNSVPVSVVYLTAFVDYNGVLNFRNDIYNYDKMQLKSVRKW